MSGQIQVPSNQEATITFDAVWMENERQARLDEDVHIDVEDSYDGVKLTLKNGKVAGNHSIYLRLESHPTTEDEGAMRLVAFIREGYGRTRTLFQQHVPSPRKENGNGKPIDPPF